MLPILIKIGPLTIRSYGLALAVGFTLAILLAMSRGRKRGVNPEMVLDLSFYLILAGIVGSRLLFILQFPRYYLNKPLSILKIWEGGLVFYGGLAAAVLVAIIYLRVKGLPKLATGDLLAPSIALGQAVGRLGCFAAGCCYGTASSGFWAVTFNNPQSLAPLHTPLHPTQLYQSAADFSVVLLLLLIDRKRRFDGQTFLSYLIFSPTARFVVEFFRGDERGAFFGTYLSPAQGFSLVMMALAVILWPILSRRRQA